MNPTWLYVAAIYAIAVALARRARVDLPWRIATLFYLLTLIFLFRPMTGPYVDLPVDFLRSLPPWAYLRGQHTIVNGELNDLTLQIIPWAHQVRESWRSLTPPLWNARSGAGYPLLGNGQSSALSLIRLIALPLRLGQSFTAEAAMKILIALTFAFLYCRRRGYSEVASSIGAISFGFCTFVTVWLHFPLVTVACFLPAVFYALDLLVERVTYKRFVLAAVLWALMLFGGHPETVAHVFVLALMTLLWIVLVERRFSSAKEAARFAGVLAAVFFVAALLAAPFLATLGEGLTKSKRFQELSVNPNEDVPWSDWPSAVLLLQPHFFGAFPGEEPWGPTHAESISGFAGILGVAAWFALLLDCIASRRLRSREFFFVLVGPLILGTILNWPIVSTISHRVFFLAANARLRLLLCFVLAMLVPAAVDLLRRDRRIVWLAGIAAAAAMLAWIMAATQFPQPWMRATATLAVMPSLAVLAVAALAALSRRIAFPALMLLIVCVIAELWKVGIIWNPVLSDRLMYESTPLIDALQTMKRATPANSPFRIVGTGAVFFPNSPAVYGFEDIRAHDPMSNGRYVGVLRVLTGYDTSDYFAKWQNITTPMLDFLNVRYVITMKGYDLGDHDRYRLVYDGGDGRIYQNLTALPRFFVTPTVVLEFNGERFIRRLQQQTAWADTALLKKLPVENDRERTDLLAPRPPNAPQAHLSILSASDTLYVLKVDAPRYTFITSSVPWWPGWHVRRNGERYTPLQVNGAFLGFVVRPGTTIVSVHFAPNTFRLGALASLLTIAALVALWRGSLRSRLSARVRLG